MESSKSVFIELCYLHVLTIIHFFLQYHTQLELLFFPSTYFNAFVLYKQSKLFGIEMLLIFRLKLDHCAKLSHIYKTMIFAFVFIFGYISELCTSYIFAICNALVMLSNKFLEYTLSFSFLFTTILMSSIIAELLMRLLILSFCRYCNIGSHCPYTSESYKADLTH